MKLLKKLQWDTDAELHWWKGSQELKTALFEKLEAGLCCFMYNKELNRIAW